MKIAIILGTRPEIIKMSPIIRQLDKRGLDYFILHTGQHYDYEMDREFFEELNLPEPRYNLNVGRSEYRKQIGFMIRRISKLLVKEKTDIAFVQGDTNSVLAGALAANRVGIKIGHHEAGLRSHDLTMLEETNRIITDHISNYLFAPTADALKNLKEEGINGNKIFLTGNTIVDAVYQNIELANRKVDNLKRLKLKKGNYILATAHRAENVDIENRLKGILDGMGFVGQYFKMPVIYPMHPRTANNIKRFRLKIPTQIKVMEPLGYLEFLQLEANSRLIITDSGGLQEEACILKIPCVTVRDNTERPETLKKGINILAGTVPEKILQSAKLIVQQVRDWKNPFGDGKAAEKILNATEEIFKKGRSFVGSHKTKSKKH